MPPAGFLLRVPYQPHPSSSVRKTNTNETSITIKNWQATVSAVPTVTTITTVTTFTTLTTDYYRLLSEYNIYVWQFWVRGILQKKSLFVIFLSLVSVKKSRHRFPKIIFYSFFSSFHLLPRVKSCSIYVRMVNQWTVPLRNCEKWKVPLK